MDLGSSPTDEDCVQLGSPDYHTRARTECARFIEVIRKNLGPEPEGARLAVKSNPHDFGVYLSVVCHYDDENEEARKYAYRRESETPRTWNDQPPQPEASAPPVLASTTTNGRVCDSCLDAAAEMMSGEDRATQELLMIEMGADVADHLCDVVEAPDTVKSCACHCRRR